MRRQSKVVVTFEPFLQALYIYISYMSETQHAFMKPCAIEVLLFPPDNGLVLHTPLPYD